MSVCQEAALPTGMLIFVDFRFIKTTTRRGEIYQNTPGKPLET